jgi:PAS domain S-box-containing protein
MKQRRSSIVIILLFVFAFSIPLLTQTRVIPDMSSVVTSITGIVDGAFAKAVTQPERIRRIVNAGRINGRWILLWIVIPGVLGLGGICFFLQRRRIMKLRRELVLVSEKRQKAQDDLKECHEYLGRIYKNAPVTVYRFRYVDQWQVDFINDAVRDLTGYAPSHFIGSPVKKFTNMTHPEDRERVGAYFESAFKDGNPLVIEYRIVNRYGRVKWVCESVMGVGDPVQDSVPLGIPVKLEGFIVDITKQKQSEIDKIKRQGMLHSLMESLPAPIYFKDRKGTYMACNRAFADLAGKKPQDVAGKTDYDLFPKNLADTFRENDLKMLSRMKPRKNNERISLPGESRKFYETLRTPLAGMDGKVFGLVGISRDITSVVDIGDGR